MVNRRFWLGMLVMLLVFGVTVVGCNNDPDNGNGGGKTDPALNGTWIGTERGMEIELKLNNGSLEQSIDGVLAGKGTYTTSGNNITTQTTHLHGDFYGLESKWYPANELLTIMNAPAEVISTTITPQTGTYTISGNTLTMTLRGQTTILTRKN